MTEFRLPAYLKLANPVIVWLQRRGVVFFTFHLISVPGRKSGQLRTTPVSPFTVAGKRYVMSVGDTEWVKNARAAGWGILSRGRKQERVNLIELPVHERSGVAREFPRLVRGGVQFFVHAGVVEAPPTAEAFAAAAPRLALFRIERSDAQQPT